MNTIDNDIVNEGIILTFEDMKLLLEAVHSFDREDMNELHEKLLDICMLSYIEEE